MEKCEECKTEFEGEACTGCGLVREDSTRFDFGTIYLYDEEKTHQHGDFRSHGVSNIAVMTKVNPKECNNADLKRALVWDSNFEWEVVKTEIVNSKIKRICFDLNIRPDRSLYFFRTLKKKMFFTGKRLENLAEAVVYITVRLDALPISLYDFKLLGCNTGKIYSYYSEFVRRLKIYHKIKPQDPRYFVMKVLNPLIPDDPATYSIKYELAKEILYYFYGILKWLKPNKITDICTFNNNAGLSGVGACIYMICKGNPIFSKITQKMIAKHCECTEVTLRKYRDKIREVLQRDEKNE